MKTAAIVVTYNRCSMLKECIEKIEGQTVDCDVIVVDNASTDNTKNVIKEFLKQYNNIKYYRLKKNTGGAGGFNFGLKAAYKGGYDFFWIMDDDTIPGKNALAKLFEAHDTLNGNYGFLSSMAVWTDGNPCIMNMNQVDVLWRERPEVLSKGIIRVKTATFVSFFVPRKSISRFGFPIKDFFIWGDDTEYALRMSREINCYWVTSSVVLHKIKNNVPTSDVVYSNDKAHEDRLFYSTRNLFYIHKKKGFLHLCYYFLYVFVQLLTVIFKVKIHKGRKIGLILKGFFTGAFYNPKIEMVEDI